MTGVFIKIVSLSRSNAYRQYVSRFIRKPVVVFAHAKTKAQITAQLISAFVFAAI